MMAQVLEKAKKRGDRYRRLPEIEAAIDVALTQDLTTLVRRAAIRDRAAAEFLPPECLVHLIRRARRTGDDNSFNALLPLLLGRCAVNLNATVAGYLPSAAELREEILGDFAELFAIDGSAWDTRRLDIFEVRFNLAFSAFRISGVRPAVAEAQNRAPMPDEPVDFTSVEDELGNDVLARLADLSGAASSPEEQVFRAQVIRAIKELPPDERNAVVLVDYMGFKEESEKPHETTAATLCGVAGRTIRNRRRRALAKLAMRLKEDA